MNILLVEDQAMVRGALAALINLEHDMNVVQQCENGKQALAYLAEHDVDLVLSDIEMPELNGIDLCLSLKAQHPQLKRVIVTTFGRAGYIKRAIDAGVDAFLLKDAPSEELVSALRQVMDGKKVIDTELALLALGDRNPLSNKEAKALKLATEGLKTEEIADKLFLSKGTVRNYLSEAISKLHATNRIDAARIAQQNGWI